MRQETIVERRFAAKCQTEGCSYVSATYEYELNALEAAEDHLTNDDNEDDEYYRNSGHVLEVTQTTIVKFEW